MTLDDSIDKLECRIGRVATTIFDCLKSDFSKFRSISNMAISDDYINRAPILYAFCIEKDKKHAVTYVGKSSNPGRLAQHIFNKNKNETGLAGSVRTKHEYIECYKRRQYNVCVFVLKLMDDVSTALLLCLESAISEQAREHLKTMFPEESYWGQRNG